MKIVHHKGRVLSLGALAATAILAYVSGRHVPSLTLYWLAAAIFVVIYWVLVMDHSEWET
jgi:hypothetical protein